MAHMAQHTFHVNGMHCASCVILTESKLKELPGVTNATASLERFEVTVEGDFGERERESIAEELSEALLPHGYSLSVEKVAHRVAWGEFAYALPIALVLIALFVVLQKLGLVNLITSTKVGYGTAFLIGAIASVSSCMAVVGGLVLSLSANFAKTGETVRPQVLFHVGRLISFFILGGAIGALGASFQLGAAGTLFMSMVVALVLLVLGINLLDIFPFARRLQLSMPSSIGKKVHGLKDMNRSFTPFILGVATFFMPCGFTQSMQLYSLTTGSFMTGALTMTAFALGTLPVLALLSFSSFGVKAQSGVFFKTAGLVVIFFAFFNITSALAASGIIPPLFSL